MALDTQWNQGGTADFRPFNYAQYTRRIYAEATRLLYGISSNYSRGWATGDCDFY